LSAGLRIGSEVPPSRDVVSGSMIVSGRVTTVAELCAREKCSVRQVNLTFSLAFPALVKAAIEGRLPRGTGVERLRDLPAKRSRQSEALGLNPECSLAPDLREKAFFGTFCASSKMPSAAMNIEFQNALVSHFQQEGLASFLVQDIGSSHDLMNLERLFVQSAQDIVSIIQHAFSQPLSVTAPY
jgi:hypothetical protein